MVRPAEYCKKRCYFAGLFAIINLLNFPIMMNVSILFEIRSVGGTAAAATSLSMYTVAGCVAGFIFGKLFQIAQRWCLSIGFVVSGIGAVLVYAGQSAIRNCNDNRIDADRFWFFNSYAFFYHMVGDCNTKKYRRDGNLRVDGFNEFRQFFKFILVKIFKYGSWRKFI